MNRFGSPCLLAGMAFAGGAIFFAGGAALFAGSAWSAIPQPPPRPPEFGKPAPAESSPENPPAAPNASPAAPRTPQTPPSGRAPVDVDVNSLQPFNLPPASRERMHQCGDEWRKLKMAGQSNGLIWRSFAEKCLAR